MARYNPALTGLAQQANGLSLAPGGDAWMNTYGPDDSAQMASDEMAQLGSITPEWTKFSQTLRNLGIHNIRGMGGPIEPNIEPTQTAQALRMGYLSPNTTSAIPNSPLQGLQQALTPQQQQLKQQAAAWAKSKYPGADFMTSPTQGTGQ